MSMTTGPLKRVAQLLEVLPEAREGEVLGADQVEQLEVEVQAAADPLASRQLAPLKHEHDDERQHEQQQRGHRQRRERQMVERRMDADRDARSPGSSASAR